VELELNLGLWHHAPPSQRRHANDISVYVMASAVMSAIACVHKYPRVFTSTACIAGVDYKE